MISPTFNASGKFGQSLNGGTGTFPISILPASNAAWTASGWVKRASVPSAVVVALGSSGTFWLGVAAAGGFAQAKYGTGGTEVTIATSVNICDGAWHHLELDMDPVNGAEFYVDGVLAGSSATTMSAAAPSRANVIGFNFFGGGANNWGGEVEEVSLWNNVLHADDFTPQAAAYTGAESGLIALYHLDGNGLDSVGSAVGFDQTKVVFSPLNWNVGTGTAKTINPGAYFRTIFGGTSCTLQFDMTGIQTPLPQISYRVDGYGAWTTVDVAASVALTIPSDTAGWANAGGRLLEVRFKSMTETQLRWATQATALSLVGIVLDSTKALTLPSKRPRSMLFLGDSLTEACRAVKATAVPDVNSHDAFLGWAPEVARLMGFEFGVVGFSAQGAVQTGVGGVPALTGTYNFLYSGVARSFAVAPDVIVINMGTNDSADVTSAMTTVLNGLLAATPKTTRIVVLRPFNGTARSAQLQAAIAASTAPTRCLFVDTNGFFVTSKSSDNLHPYGNANIGDIAPAVVNAIQAFVAPIRGARTARTISLPLFQDLAGVVPAADATGLVWSFFDQTSADSLTVAADSGTTAAISGGALNLSVFSTKAAGQQGYLVLTNADGSKAFRGVVTLS